MKILCHISSAPFGPDSPSNQRGSPCHGSRPTGYFLERDCGRAIPSGFVIVLECWLSV